MTSSEFFSLLSAISLFAIAIALVPTFLQFRRTLQKLEVCIENLNRHIDPMCVSLTEAANEFQLLSLSLNEKMEKTDKVIDTARKSVEILFSTATLFKETVRPVITQVGGFSAGVLAFSHFLTRSKKTPTKGD